MPHHTARLTAPAVDTGIMTPVSQAESTWVLGTETATLEDLFVELCVFAAAKICLKQLTHVLEWGSKDSTSFTRVSSTSPSLLTKEPQPV